MANAPKKTTATDRVPYRERFKFGARMPLRTFREARTVTQVDVAERSGIDQSEISKIERTSLEGRSVGVLRRLVEATGAKLELVAIDDAGRRYILVDPDS